jgi:hypothetical protein
MSDPRANLDAARWIRRGTALGVLLVGWVFIVVQNDFYITPPVVFVCLGYLAAVVAVYTLFRTGATAVAANEEDDGELSFDRPVGPYAELEREKRTLLKAIKEAEFDHQMGKLSKADADAMIAIYRARAIEVIKELDIKDSTSGTAGSVRDQILREVKARIALDRREEKAAAKPFVSRDKKQQRADALKKAAAAADKAADAASKAAAAATAAASPATSSPAVPPPAEPIESAAADGAANAAADEAQAAATEAKQAAADASEAAAETAAAAETEAPPPAATDDAKAKEAAP